MVSLAPEFFRWRHTLFRNSNPMHLKSDPRNIFHLPDWLCSLLSVFPYRSPHSEYEKAELSSVFLMNLFFIFPLRKTKEEEIKMEFYPTPKTLLDQIFEGADWKKIETVLEPSAGKEILWNISISKIQRLISTALKLKKICSIS